MAYCYIAIGSNLGDKATNLIQALKLIDKVEKTSVYRISQFFKTQAVGGPPDQEDFFNSAAIVKTELEPEELLDKFQEIENAMGRVRAEKWGPRIIDIDILLYEDAIIATDRLTVPHPLMHARKFVLEPLSSIAPDVFHPVLLKTVAELLKEFNNA